MSPANWTDPSLRRHGEACAILFDLFGTLVYFRPHVPTVEVGGQPWRSALEWLAPLCAQHLPEVPFTAFLEALLETTREIAAQRPPEFREVPSVERFTRALRRLGLPAARCDELAPRFSAHHMQRLTAETVLAPRAREVLSAFRPHAKLVLVSNFDHEAAARSVLDRYGLSGFFDLVLISAAFGRRKPHPAIFLAGLEPFAIAPEQAWFVGDNYAEDIEGAKAVGLRPVWVCAAGPPHPPADGVHVVHSLDEVVPLVLAGKPH